MVAQQLEARGLVVTDVQDSSSWDVPDGLVEATSPRAGQPFVSGDPITIWVSTGPPPPRVHRTPYVHEVTCDPQFHSDCVDSNGDPGPFSPAVACTFAEVTIGVAFQNLDRTTVTLRTIGGASVSFSGSHGRFTFANVNPSILAGGWWVEASTGSAFDYQSPTYTGCNAT